MMKIIPPKFRIGDKVSVKPNVLAVEKELASVIEGKPGRVVKTYVGQEWNTVVCFGVDIDEWSFSENELEAVE